MGIRILMVLAVAGVLVLGALAWRRSRTPTANITSIDPKSILFSLPTLCDQLPPLLPGVPQLPPGAYRLHEDDWRQVEFVSAPDRAIAEKELGELRNFKMANQVGQAWKAVYVRKSRSGAILSSRVPFARVVEIVNSQPVGPLFLDTMGAPAQVQGGFVLRLSPDAVLYGFQQDGVVVSLNLDGCGNGPYPKAPLSQLCREFKLVLVDWYHTTIFESSE